MLGPVSVRTTQRRFMRTLQLLTLALLATAARADDFATVSAHINDRIQYPNCSATDTGVSFASASFACTISGGSISGEVTARPGRGPSGIGALALLCPPGALSSRALCGDA